MGMQRVSFDMPSEEHRYLKMCCAKLGVSQKEFITRAILDKIECAEDVWLFHNSFEDNDGDNYVLIDHDGNLNAI